MLNFRLEKLHKRGEIYFAEGITFIPVSDPVDVDIYK